MKVLARVLPYLPTCYINLFVYLTRWRFKSISIMQWIIFCLVITSKWLLMYSIILLYFIRLNNSYCAENLNIVLDHVITVLLFCLCLFNFLISKNVTISISTWILSSCTDPWKENRWWWWWWINGGVHSTQRHKLND
jgi:hypothetical protein